MLEFFISKRYLLSKHKLNFITIISILSTLGITIGVAALVIVLSVFNGFGGIVTSILVNFDPHIRVQLISQTANNDVDHLFSLIKNDKNIKHINPYAQGKAILLSDNNHEVINIKGVAADSSLLDWGPADRIISGEFNIEKKGRLSKIVLGSQMALRLSRFVGDTLTATSFGDLERSLVTFTLPTTKQFIVTGIFKTNNREYDYNYVFTDLKSAQQLIGLKEQVSGYEVRLMDIDGADDIKSKILANIDNKHFAVYTWYDLHKDLYDVMLIERWATYIILCLIIAVATFNILGSLTMSVIEKQKDIGILKAMGVSDKSILKIFMFEGLLVGTFGTIAGLILGLTVCYLQIEYNFYSLDPSRYIIDALPLEIRISDILAISGASMLLSIVSSLYPAKKAAKVSVLESIKWE